MGKAIKAVVGVVLIAVDTYLLHTTWLSRVGWSRDLAEDENE